MFREIKYLLYIITIFIFIFFIIRFYLSETYEKKFFKSYNLVEKENSFKISDLVILEDDTKNIIEYTDIDTNEEKNKYKFWKLLETD